MIDVHGASDIMRAGRTLPHVIPAKAGIQLPRTILDPRLRGGDIRELTL